MNLNKNFFRIKPIEVLIEEGNESNFKRTLDVKQLIFLGIGATVGAGIFVITGKAASLYAGAAIPISFMISGVTCICAGFCYAEFASLIPISGSSYVYSYAIFGELPAWIIGILVLFANTLSVAIVSKGWASYILSLVNVENSGNINSFLSCFILFIVAFILCLDVSVSSKLNFVAVIIKMTSLIVFIVVCFGKIDIKNFTPFFASFTSEGKIGGFSGIFDGAALVFMAFTGFEAIATAAQEAKNPRKDIPISMTLSILICMTLYILVSTTLVGVVHFTNLNVMNPIAVAMNKINLPWLSVIIKISSVSALTSVILVIMYSLTRITYCLAKDSFLPSFLLTIHEKYKTPYVITVFYFLLITFIVFFIPLDKLNQLANFCHLMNFLIVCIGILYINYKREDLKKKSIFSCPFKPWVPIFGISFISYLLFRLFFSIYIYIIVFFFLSIIFYFFYSKKNIEKSNNKWLII